MQRSKSSISSQVLAAMLAAVLLVAGLVALVPMTALAGDYEWTPSGLQGMAVRVMAFSPDFANDRTVFAGTDYDGLYKSTDAGASWVKTGLSSPYSPQTSMYSVAVSPGFAADRTLFAVASGEIYKSTDAGATWSNADPSLVNMNSVAVSPNFVRDNIVVAGGSKIYKSTDGGATWTETSGGFAGSNPSVCSFGFSPNFANDATVFAAAYFEGVFKSTDGGNNWTRVDSGLAYPTSADVSPAYPQDGTVFVGTRHSGVYKTSNGGQSWTAVRQSADLTYDSIAISPGYASDGTVLIGGSYGGVERSTNGGQTWENVGMTGYDIRAVAFSPSFVTDRLMFSGTNANGIHSYTDGSPSPPPPADELAWATKAPLPMALSRTASAAVDGKLYVLGGDAGSGAVSSAVNAYDPGTDTWQPAAALSEPRFAAASASNAHFIYVVGGSSAFPPSLKRTVLKYDTSNGTCTTAGLINTARFRTSAAILNDKLYVVGGNGPAGSVLASMEVFDLTTNAVVDTVTLPAARSSAGVAVVGDKLYITGGMDSSGAPTNTCWEFDPATNLFTEKSLMPVAVGSRAVASASGKVYVAGGMTSVGYPPSAWTADVQEYDPAADTWRKAGSIPTSRYGPAVEIVNDALYVIGGDNGSQMLDVNEVAALPPSVEPPSPDNIFTWAAKAPMPTARLGAMTGVLDGQIFVVGGSNRLDPPPRGTLDTVEVYNTTDNSWHALAPLIEPRFAGGHASEGDMLYIAGGTSGSADLDSVVAYNMRTGMSSVVGHIGMARFRTAAGIVGGKLYVVGGWGATGALSSVEEYDVSSNAVTNTFTMPGPRDMAAVVTLGSKLYIVGGFDAGRNVLDSCLEFDPATGAFTEIGPMPMARGGNDGVMALDGKLYVLGGAKTPGPPPIGSLTSVQEYDPSTGMWRVVGDNLSARWGVATQVVNGVVYAIGGSDDVQALSDNKAGTRDGLPPADTTPPTTTAGAAGTLGDNGWYTSDVELTLTAVDNEGGSGVDAIEYSFDGNEWLTYASPIIISTEGASIVRYRARDDAGNVEQEHMFGAGIDKTAPASTIVLNGTLGLNDWYISDVVVSFAADDAYSGVSRIEYSSDGTHWYAYNGSWAAIIHNGATIYYYRAVDGAGNVEAVNERLIRADQVIPVTSADYSGAKGANDIYVSGVAVTLTPVDQFSPTFITKYSLDGTNWSVYSGPFTISREGATTLYYYSMDEAGNTEMPRHDTLNIDTVAPSTPVFDAIDPVHAANASCVTVRGMAESGSTVYVTATDGAQEIHAGTVATGVFSIDLDLSSLADGQVVFTAYAQDQAGNESPLSLAAIAVKDTVAPQTAISTSGSMGGSGWYVSEVVVELSAVDENAVAATEYSLNGDDWQAYAGAFTLSAEGASTVFYRSLDAVGNVEEIREHEIRIDTTAPVVSVTNPANGAVGVPVNQSIRVTFGEAIQAGPNIDAVTVKKGKSISVSTSVSGNVMTITPASGLQNNSLYVVDIPAGSIKDIAGNTLALPFSFSFTTVKK